MSYYHDCKDYLNISNYYCVGKEITSPITPSLEWQFDEECNDFTVLLSKNKNMENPVSFSATSSHHELKNLFAGTTYYYQVKAHLSDKTILSKRKSFKTVDFFRTVEISGVYNARDIGNKETIDGKRVKQGLVYRTANFDSVTPLGKEQAQELGIKTDLDLREQGPTSSPLGDNVNYINNGVSEKGSPLYVSITSGVNSALYQPVMRDNLKVFTNKDNFPLAFHCAVGRDRTGTLAITLYLLLGVKLEQIKQDYVVSFFSKACNSEDLNGYDSLMDTLLTHYEYYKERENPNGGSIYKRVEQYCLDIGLTKAEIESIRDNLLE